MTALTPHQEFLAARTDEAVHDGQQLLRWCRETNLDAMAFPLDLGKPFRLANRATGYFGSVAINGKTESVMGCRQRVDFGAAAKSVTREDVIDFMAGEFLPRAHWTNPEGAPGGFTIVQDVYRDASGSLGVFDKGEQQGCLDWRRLGNEFQWVLLTVEIHDFVMEMGPFKKRFREAACVSPHSAFMSSAENPAPGVAFEYSVGYPFVKFAPVPNVFGFGPGKFGVAIKLYKMQLHTDGRVGVQMDFAAAPRCPKVFDFGDAWPDPVYSLGRAFEKLTFGMWKFQPMRDKMESQMLAQHSRVHQSLMDGVELTWQDWLRTRK